MLKPGRRLRRAGAVLTGGSSGSTALEGGEAALAAVEDGDAPGKRWDAAGDSAGGEILVRVRDHTNLGNNLGKISRARRRLLAGLSSAGRASSVFTTTTGSGRASLSLTSPIIRSSAWPSFLRRQCTRQTTSMRSPTTSSLSLPSPTIPIDDTPEATNEVASHHKSTNDQPNRLNQSMRIRWIACWPAA